MNEPTAPPDGGREPCAGCVICYARRNIDELPESVLIDRSTAAAVFELAIRESLERHGLDETCTRTAYWLAWEIEQGEYHQRALNAVVAAIGKLGFEVEVDPNG